MYLPSLCSLQTEPYLIKKMLNTTIEGGHPPVGNQVFEGYCADLAKKVADLVSIQYLIVPVKDGAYGSEKNGSWNGMVGELVRNVSVRVQWFKGGT